MAIQLSVATRNARLNAIETTIGTAPILRIRSGSAPANCAASDTGTVLAQLTLPSNWLADAASGAKALAGSWTDSSANASGTAAHFRIYDSGDVACHLQGTVSATSGDMLIDTVTIVAGQVVTVTAFTLTDANA